MKRTEQAVSAASAAKRSCASGSRSIAMSVPSGPSRCATRRACPPSPKVQSIAVWPGWGSSSSSSSRASTGVWAPLALASPSCLWAARARAARLEDEPRAGGLASPEPFLRACTTIGDRPEVRPSIPARRAISGSVIGTGGDLRDAAQQRRSMFAPGGLGPQLHAVAHAHHDDLLGQSGVLAEEARDHDAPGGVKLGVVGAAVEEALQLGQARRQRRQLGQGALGVALVLLRTPHAHARL